MFHVFTADTADDLWWAAASHFRTEGNAALRDSRAGPTHEILHVGLELRDPRARWIASRYPALNIAFALAEVVWIARGRQDSAFVNYFNNALPKYAGEGLTYHAAYGFRLRHALGFDQLERAYQALKAQPDSRQVVLQIWNSPADFPGVDGKPVAPNIPCNIVAMLKIRDGRLEWTQVMRSNDLFRGFVHNVVQFTCLQEIMAGWLGTELGSYHHFSDSLHVYSENLNDLEKSSRSPVPTSTDRLNLSKDLSDEMFAKLEKLVELIISDHSGTEQIISSWESLQSPPSIRNIACILVCEGLRRRNHSSSVMRLLGSCTNPAYSFHFQRWLARVKFPLCA